MLEQFHFLYPGWLLLLIPLGGLLWLLRHRKKTENAWHKVIEPQLLKQLLVNAERSPSNWPSLLLAIGGLLAILALADPVWQKLPQPVFQTTRSMVMVLDLSASMNAADLKPSRLVRARLKLRDILNRENEGQLGLVVFAGDAFSVTPLTRDNETIRSQLRVLEPDIMPVQGSRLDLGLQQADELLTQANISSGDILVIADGYESALTGAKVKALHDKGHRISVLGIGTPEGAPISDGYGGVLQDADNKPVLARLDGAGLKKLAQLGGGRYSRIRSDNADIDYLLNQPPLSISSEKSSRETEHSRWRQQGPLLAALLLPLAALAFRRGWLFSLLLAVCITLPPQTSYAFGWQDLWQTREQQASAALQQQRLKDAASLSSDPRVVGSALYKQQQYQQALQNFEQDHSADACYNRGNALAHLGKYQEAIDSYQDALQQQPQMQDAITNKKILEELLRQQQKQQQDNKNSDSQQQSSQNNEQQSKDQKDSADGKQQESADNNQQQQQKKQNSDNSKQQGSPQNQQQQQAGNNQQAEQQPDKDQQQQPSQSADQSAEKQQPPTSANQFADANQQLEQQKEQQEQPQPQQTEASSDAKAEQNKPTPTANESRQPTRQQQAQSGEQQQLSSEEQMAAEQWLRRIPDDPGGLLKRKFLYQYQQRANRSRSRQPW